MSEEEKQLLKEFIELFNGEDVGSLSGDFEYWWFTNGDEIEEIIQKIT